MAIKEIQAELIRLTLNYYELRLRTALDDALFRELPDVLRLAELGDLEPLRQLIELVGERYD